MSKEKVPCKVRCALTLSIDVTSSVSNFNHDICLKHLEAAPSMPIDFHPEQTQVNHNHVALTLFLCSVLWGVQSSVSILHVVFVHCMESLMKTKYFCWIPVVPVI